MNLPLTFDDIIAARFLNSVTNRALVACVDCGQRPTKQCTITKRYMNGEPVYDMLVCSDCTQKVIEMSSPESMQHMMGIGMRLAGKLMGMSSSAANMNMDANTTQDQFMANMLVDVMMSTFREVLAPDTAKDPSVPHCLWTDEPIDISGTFSICSLHTFPGGEPNEALGDLHYFITDAYVEEMVRGMSKDTEKAWRGYMQELFPDLSPSLLPVPVE